MHDVAIIGGGPAGITAAIYCARKKLSTLLISRDFIGQVGIAGPIDNWPGDIAVPGPVLMQRFEQHLREYDVDIVEESVVSITKDAVFEVSTEDSAHKAKTVLIATGRKPMQLGVPGEKNFIGKGVVYCTTCDAPIYQDKKVIIAGGGNNGFSSAIEMTDFASEVTLIESQDVCTADEMLQDKAREKGVTILTNCHITEILGDDFVTNVRYVQGGKETFTDIDGVFIEIGSVPNTDFCPEALKQNEAGEIIIDYKTCATNIDGLFAAGDATTVKDKQIVTAAAEGAKAALSIYEYLKI
jgi:NADH-dependent peroxiredoxin subunit F